MNKKTENLTYYIKLLLILSCLLFLGGCYLLKQGSYIISYNSGAKKIDLLLKDPNMDPQLREIFILTQQIKTFAIEALGLNNDNNYTTYVHIDKTYLADVVSACKKDTFKSFTWWYPFFGSFPYKGFFEREDALKEVESLKKKDLDVLMRQVDAFSTLGFFTDPLYSYMSDYSVFTLASLIIHEQLHATIWVNNSVQFNEECATFVGHEGALYFIRKKYGKNSEKYSEAINSLEDGKRFMSYIKLLYKDLNELYTMDIDSKTKREAKSLIIRAFRDRFRSVYFREFHNKNYKNIGSFHINNAYIMLYITYTQDVSIFYDLYQKQDYDLRKTLDILKEVQTQKGDPKEWLRELIYR